MVRVRSVLAAHTFNLDLFDGSVPSRPGGLSASTMMFVGSGLGSGGVVAVVLMV